MYSHKYLEQKGKTSSIQFSSLKSNRPQKLYYYHHIFLVFWVFHRHKSKYKLMDHFNTSILLQLSNLGNSHQTQMYFHRHKFHWEAQDENLRRCCKSKENSGKSKKFRFSMMRSIHPRFENYYHRKFHQSLQPRHHKLAHIINLLLCIVVSTLYIFLFILLH